MDKQPQLPGSRAKDVMCKRWDTLQITFEIPIHLWHPVKNGGVLDPEFDSA